MAISETITSQTAQIRLNNGQTTTGAVKTVNVSIGTLNDNPATWDAQKAINIVDALSPIFDRTMYRVTRTAVYDLVDEG